jgi:UbiD family decarboxylase
MISNSDVLDTNFRSAIDRMINRGRIEAFTSPIDTNLAVAGVMKKRDGGPALLFTTVDGYAIPIIGNLLCCRSRFMRNGCSMRLELPVLRGLSMSAADRLES